MLMLRLAIAAASLVVAAGFFPSTTSIGRLSTLFAENYDAATITTRRSFCLSTSAAGAFFTAAPPAWAKKGEVDPTLKGTKQDPAYEACISKCLYDCTKPKGEEQKSRAECLPECKKSCATTKEQLMLGTPIKK